jgi:uncharacterized protein (DUF488 family)
MSTIFTIGFTGKSAPVFFDLLTTAGIKTVLDTRLNNTSQLAGFSKKEDLRFFLSEIGDIKYIESKDLAPEKSLLKRYQRKEVSWEVYEEEYINLLEKRNVERLIDRDVVSGGCLLCSEHLPHNCHRRLAAEYLQSHWGASFDIKHLVNTK